jgi:uncharacterized damage-inducible protein DinB
METIFRRIACPIILGLTFCFAVCNSVAAQGGAAGSAATVQGDLLKDWQAQKNTVMGIADAMPADKFGYKATPAERSYGEQVMHVALINVALLKLVGGKATVPSFTTQSATTKEQMIKALADSYDYGTALLQEHTDTTLTQTITGPQFLGPSTRARIFWFLMSHSMDTYGQMVVYLHLNDIVPPASRK